MTTPYPKRLIEVDLPIARISAHARREKSIRHGHISTLHIWWARRPLAACRAVILASLWPDPVDLTEWAKEADAKGEVRAPKNEALKLGEGVVIRPKRFLDEARQRMIKWSQIALGKASNESYKLLVQVSKNPKLLDDPATLRTALLDFIADFANWDNSTDKDYLETSRALVQAAHESLGGEAGTKPMVIDPFAGGGSIPLEALRVGAESFASDLNPLPILLNTIVLQWVPRYGKSLAAAVRRFGKQVRDAAASQLERLYPTDADGSTVIAYVWARTVLSEAPGQGDVPAEVPLIRSMWLSEKATKRRALRWIRTPSGEIATRVVEVQRFVDNEWKRLRVRQPLLEVFTPGRAAEVEAGTTNRGSVTCPVTGFTTKVTSVRSQLIKRTGGARDPRLLAVVTSDINGKKEYRNPSQADAEATQRAILLADSAALQSQVPDAELPLMSGVFNVPLYGHTTWNSLFTPRQLVALATLSSLIREIPKAGHPDLEDQQFAWAVTSCLACALDRQADYGSSLCRWVPAGEFVGNTFGRQALGMVFDFCEVPVISAFTGGFSGAVEWVATVLENNYLGRSDSGHVERASATSHPLPDDSANAIVTDPPYYNAVPYADLSDFFYLWLRRTLSDSPARLFVEQLSPKAEELCEMAGWDPRRYLHKNGPWFESQMTKAMSEARRFVRPDGIGVVVFAHKSTAGWEAQLQALVDAQWVVTGSWPIDTEMQARLRAKGSAALASSVHLVIRPRELASGLARAGDVGEWREVLDELPKRLDEWMPRLADEGVVGADAIFACLGPALEIFSRYSRVEKASGETVTLREYLEHVWAAVSSEALSMIFKDADAAGLEPDARLTAMWLWTLGGGKPQASSEGEDGEEAESDDDEETTTKKVGKVAGFVLEYDAARKIAQGLGIHLEKSESIVEVKGESARLLPVSERTRHLFGKDAEEDTAKTRKAKKKAKQGSLFEELDAIEAEAATTGGRFGGLEGAKPGATVLDKVHQSMILFAAGRGEALKRFLVEDGVGKDGRYWKLAQSLSALYPTGTDEKRWVDGVLARKKGLGF
jgi:putative DNA methylase